MIQNKPVVMRLFGDAMGRPTRHDGKYLKAFDFEAHNGQGEITMTADIGEAMRFPDFEAAWRFWKSSPKCRPIRPDGKPNRPLTSTNWQFETAPEKVQ